MRFLLLRQILISDCSRTSESATFNPSLFYLKYWMSQLADDSFHPHLAVRSCNILQNVLMGEEPIMAEHHGRIKELRNEMRMLIIRHIPNTNALFSQHGLSLVSEAIDSVYRELQTSRDDLQVEGAEACKCYTLLLMYRLPSLLMSLLMSLLDMLQLLNMLFKQPKCVDIYYHDIWSSKDLVRLLAIKELSRFFKFKNVFGWFLSSGGSESEDCITSVLQYVEDKLADDSLHGWTQPVLREANAQFSQLALHKRGVELLAPRNERLHLCGTGFRNNPSPGNYTALTSSQQSIWMNAFTSLTENLRCVHIDHLALLVIANYDIFINQEQRRTAHFAHYLANFPSAA